jgi:carboxypeptidase C (cathepsin A)
VTNTEASAVFFAEFLAQFYTQYPKLKSNALYLFGESFAGHYIPAIGVKILASEKLKDVMFTGVGIGDGWTSPINQVPYILHI